MTHNAQFSFSVSQARCQQLCNRERLVDIWEPTAAALFHCREQEILGAFDPDASLLRAVGDERYYLCCAQLNRLLEKHLIPGSLLKERRCDRDVDGGLTIARMTFDNAAYRTVFPDIPQLNYVSASLTVYHPYEVSGLMPQYPRQMVRLFGRETADIPAKTIRRDEE